MTPLVTIVTPTYNRAYTLGALYASLRRQTSRDFVWLIIDDGSTDDTADVLAAFDSVDFPIRYIRKENGGKHTALNVAFKAVDTELTFIVDSDDVLTDDAVATIEKDWRNCHNRDLCGISYLRGYDTDTIIGDAFPKDNIVDNFIRLRFNKNICGDKAEVWRTDLLRQHPFPVFEGEKFFGESFVWIAIAREYNMLIRNKILYITEYLDGGLSQSGRALRIRCPQGGMATALNQMTSEFSYKQRLKGAILYVCYGRFAGKTMFAILRHPHVFLKTLAAPLGIALYYRWRRLL